MDFILLFFFPSDGGVYANNIITRKYKQGQVIDVEVLLTTAHLGHFEFRIGDFSSSETAGNSIGKLKGRLMELVSALQRWLDGVDYNTQ